MDSLRKKPSAQPVVDLRSHLQQQPQQDPREKDPHASSENFQTATQEDFYYPEEKAAITTPVKKGWVLRFFKKFFLLSFIFILLALIAYASFFLWKSYSIRKKIVTDQPQATFATHVKEMVSTVASTHTPLQGEQEGRVNILLLGAAGQHDAGKNLTDTIMIMSIDTKNKKVGLLSLPRDLYVNIPDTHTYTKINTLYQYGLSQKTDIDPLKQAVEKITNLPIHYYAVLNYDGFKKIIDAIDGINVMVERDIYDTRYPGPNFSYETFELSKGFHTLDGETALKYVRERHDDPQGDFGRAKRQQQVMQSVKNKMFSAQTMFDVMKINAIMNAIGDNIKTNISIAEMESFLALAHTLDTQNINTVVVDAWKKDSLLKVSHVMVGSIRAFILVPRIGNYSEIQEATETLFNHEALTKRKVQIENERATVELINASGEAELARKVRDTIADKIPFASVRIGSAAKISQQEETIVVDHTNGEKLFSVDELLKKLPAKSGEASSEKTQADITVILGSDLIGSYTYEEDSIDDYTQNQDAQMDMLIEP